MPATQGALDILEKENILAIIGPSGSGKTKCALDILSTMNEAGMKILKLTDIRLWYECVNANEPCCVWFDDLLENRSDNYIVQNRSIFHTVKACAQKGKVKVIFTIRSDVYTNYQSSLSQFVRESCFVDLESDIYRLTRNLKIKILNRHLQVNRNPEQGSISESTIDEIVQSKPLLGYPLCCYLFSSIRTNFQQGSAFFECPSKELIQSLSELRTSDKQKYLLLGYAALKNKVIDCNSVDHDLVNEISHVLDIGSESFQSSMMDGTKDKTYFRREKYQVYAIKHLSIYKAVMASLAEISNDMKRKVITVLQPSILCETIIPEEISVEDYEYSIVVPKSMFRVIAADITGRHKQDCASLLCSGLFDSDDFIDELIDVKGDTWSEFCLQYFKYGCRYGKLGLTQRMLATLTKTSSGRDAIFPGLKEACIKGHDGIVHYVFEKASACVSTDEVIRLVGYLWRNYDLCVYVLDMLRDRNVNENAEQCKTVLSYLARDGDVCLKLFEQATKILAVTDTNVICDAANIAGRRGSLHMLQLLLNTYVEIEQELLHSAIQGVCTGGAIELLHWIIRKNETCVEKNVLEYLKHSETPDIVQLLLRYESKLNKLELGELLNEHCASDHPLIVKVLIDKCTRLSESDLQNALEFAYKNNNLNTVTVIMDIFSIPSAMRETFEKDVQSRRGGIRTPWTTAWTPYDISIPSYKVFTPDSRTFKNPEPTIKQLLKHSLKGNIETHNKAITLMSLCTMRDELNGRHISDCRELLSSEPKIPEFLVVGCAICACKQGNHEIAQLLCEYYETLPSQILEKNGKRQLDTETIQCIHVALQLRGQNSLFVFIEHVLKNGKDLKGVLCSLEQCCQFDLNEYLEVVQYIVQEHDQYAHVILDYIETIAERADILLSACRGNFSEIVRFLLQQQEYSNSTALNDAIVFAADKDKSDIIEIICNYKSNEDIKDIFVRCCILSARLCVQRLLNKIVFHQYIECQIADILTGVCSSLSMEIIETIITSMKMGKKTIFHVLSVACTKNWLRIVQVIKEKYSAIVSDKREVLKIVKNACASDNGHLVRHLLQGMTLTGKQWTTVVMNLVCKGHYLEAEEIMEHENLDWSSPQLSIPKNINEQSVEFACKVVLSTGHGKDVFQHRIIEKFPNVVNQMVNHTLNSDNVNLVHELLQEMSLSEKQWATVVMTLVCRGYYQEAEHILDREKIDLSSPDLSLPNNITEQFTEFVGRVVLSGRDNEYNFLQRVVKKFPHIVNRIFLYICKDGYFELEDNSELIRILNLNSFTDDVVMEGVNIIIEQEYESTDTERWTCTHQPTAHTLYEVLEGDQKFCTCLICSQWMIDDNVTEDIALGKIDKSDVWKMLLDKFQSEITDDMKFKILTLCCKYSDDNKSFKAVLNTDKQRKNDEVCTLLSACKDDKCAIPLLQKYQNLPLQDVLRVMNHLIIDMHRLELVYKITEVYSEYHDVYRAMRDEMQLEPAFFDISDLYLDFSKSVVAKVVKKFIDHYARSSS